MVISKTLLIKHLPHAFDKKDKEEFLKYFGAKEIKFLDSEINKYNTAFARFENENVAEIVLHRLHQTTVLGSCLSVEFAKDQNIGFNLPQQSCNIPDIREKKANEEYYEQFLKKLCYWQSGLNFKQPVPCHLKYQYPPPNNQVVYNIIKVLITVPKFYTQVLHLMNKMNLPCPFAKNILPNLDVTLESFFNELKLDKKEKPEEKINDLEETSSESEISSDEEMGCQIKEIIPEKQNLQAKKPKRIAKRFKPASVLKTCKIKKTKFEDVFEKSDVEPKKIKLNNITSLAKPDVDCQTKPSDHLSSQPNLISTGFGYICPLKSNDIHNKKVNNSSIVEENNKKEEINCISENELVHNRVSEKDRCVLPVFKNYAEGAPTCRLYIKNLAKTVTDLDLRYIYNRYLTTNVDDEPNMFDIRLMQEGRMKGQAFVTLQSVELAQKALKETNGFILKDKPLVVQFARSSKN